LFSFFQLICLPSSRDQGTDTYSFGLSTDEGGPNKQGRTDFLMSTNSTLTSLGSQTEILRVRASDDTFRKLKDNFTKLDKEKEKKSTVLLDNKDKKRAMVPKGQVIRKVVRDHSSSSSSRTSSSTTGSSSSSSSGNLHPSYTGLGPGRGNMNRPASPQIPSSRSQPSSSSSLSSPSSSSSVSSATSSTNTSQRSHPPAVSRPPPSRPPPTVNTEIMKRPLRDRLIHLLAVRPYKKLELLPRIQKDGLKEKDKKNISQLLREVSDYRNNVYELRRSMWNEVAEDWPFYSDQDRAALRRRKPQNLTPPGSDTGSTSSGHSPSSTNPPSPPQITNPLKRPTNPYYPQPEKKIRMSNYQRPGSGHSSWDQKARSPGLLMPDARSSGSMSSVSVSPRLDLEYDKPVEDDSAPDWGRWGQDQQQSPGRDPAPEPATHSGAESPDQSGPRLQLAPNRNLDFIAAYTTIVTAEQRIKYKSEFNQYYDMYRKLHNVLDQVSKRFTSLESQLNTLPKGSEEFRNVKARIKQEYEKNKQDTVYQEARSNFHYLHEKLAHIKKLVHDYDIGKAGAR